MKFVDIKNDIAFRKIFGNSKKSICLISFLNAVLELEGTNRIKAVTFLNPYLLPRLAHEKSSIIDVRATDQKNRRFIVEMQVADKKGFNERVQYYAARDYSMQINSGEDYQKLQPTYFIGILDFGIGRGANYLSKHLTIEEETGDNILQDIKYAFIQLSKFKKKEHELVTSTDKWTYFIKNAKDLKVIPNYVDDEGLLLAFQEADKHNWNKEDLIDYDNMLMRIQDARGELELALELAVELATNNKEKDMIIEMYKDGLLIEQIARISKLPIEEVQKIIDEYQRLKK